MGVPIFKVEFTSLMDHMTPHFVSKEAKCGHKGPSLGSSLGPICGPNKIFKPSLGVPKGVI